MKENKMTIAEIKTALEGRSFVLYGRLDFDNALMSLGYDSWYDCMSLTDLLDEDTQPLWYGGDCVPDILVTVHIEPEYKSIYNAVKQRYFAAYDNGDDYEQDEATRDLEGIYCTITIEEC